MGQSTDQIRQEIDMNRQNAADKIDQIQSQIENTADQLRSGVQDSAQQVRDQVKGTIDDTVETMKQSMDMRQQIEERPLVALGAALVGGFVLGGLMGGDDHERPRGEYTRHDGNGRDRYPSSSQQGGSLGHTIRSAMQKTGLDDTISNAAAALIGSVTDQVRETIDRNFPGFSDKMQTAQHSPGGFAEKTRETQSV